MKVQTKPAPAKALRSILLWTVVFGAVMALLSLVLHQFGYQLLRWVYYVCIALVFLGALVGSIQLLCWKKPVPLALGIATLLAIPFFAWFAFLGMVFGGEESIQPVGYGKMVVLDQSWLDPYIFYYDYVNPFVRPTQERVRISNKTVTYYDPNGNLVKYEDPDCTRYYDGEGNLLGTFPR